MAEQLSRAKTGGYFLTLLGSEHYSFRGDLISFRRFVCVCVFVIFQFPHGGYVKDDHSRRQQCLHSTSNNHREKCSCVNCQWCNCSRGNPKVRRGILMACHGAHSSVSWHSHSVAQHPCSVACWHELILRMRILLSQQLTTLLVV